MLDSFEITWTEAYQASLSSTVSQSLLKFISIELVMLSNHLILCHPLLLLPSVFSNIGVFSKLALHIRWPKYWRFSISISPSNEYSGLISFKIDWFDLLAVRGTPSPRDSPTPQFKIICHTTQQSHCWAYTPRKPELKEIHVPQCSSQHYL